MKTFEYTITDPVGIHARPAGIIVKKASEYKSCIKLKKDDKEADAKRIFAIMGLGVKSGDRISVLFDGEDEDKAYDDLLEFFNQNL